ncbi:MAG: multiheme c-type cytochrome [Phycisphaerae bacterium]
MNRRWLASAVVRSAVLGFAAGAWAAEPDPTTAVSGRAAEVSTSAGKAFGVCPPFKLRDERGNIIDPVHGVNDKAPYSPKQTCGACHDYEKITRGYHFTQGKGEVPPKKMADRYLWVTSPGNYGGNWCSPSPLYRQLAPKTNTNARMIDMTSFDFVTATCGNCHPGGGPLEYDRHGNRYDTFMHEHGLTDGGDNGLDGDYYKARWEQTGVIEADCLLCHMPAYDHKARNAQLANLNFRWAATEGAGLGRIKGKVAANEHPEVTYDVAKFDAEGNLAVNYASEPRNETCLTCHAKPGWKKRGAAFSGRTDVHMKAGLRCVDCHAAGSKAASEKIRGREEHQFGKGDDPSGWVRNDLDDTVRSCADCHLRGWNNAPRATHAWLPPLHMEKLSCQACHIPARSVKSALVQASDVYNHGPRITPPPKHIWTFYDQEMNYWNHYGELELFTVHDQPTNISRPTLAVYKGKVYPVNRVHSMWVGYEEKGKPGLNQLFMKDFFTMWKEHLADPKNRWPQLAVIADDNGDGAPEVNRSEEIDALLAACKAYLEKTKFPLENRRLVWVSDDRAYYSSSESRVLPREDYEATPYASVYKLSHDVAPAGAALGAGGCTDCHRIDSPFFDRAVLATAFDPVDAKPRWMPNYSVLGLSRLRVRIGGLREEWLKPVLYALIGLTLSALVSVLVRTLALRHGGVPAGAARALGLFVFAGTIIMGAIAVATPDLLEYMTVRRFMLDANHFWISCLVLLIGLVVALRGADASVAAGRLRPWSVALWVSLVFTSGCGALILLKVEWLQLAVRPAYTGLDLGLTVLSALSLLTLVRELAASCRGAAIGQRAAATGAGRMGETP